VTHPSAVTDVSFAIEPGERDGKTERSGLNIVVDVSFNQSCAISFL
jgi:hypothetical protein